MITEMLTILVENIQVYAFHGVPDAEREVGHRYEIDLTMEVDGRAPDTDRMEDTVDYGAAALEAERIVKESQFRTIERLAGEIGNGLLKKFSKIEEIQVSVRKPLPPTPLIADAAGVTLTLSR